MALDRLVDKCSAGQHKSEYAQLAHLGKKSNYATLGVYDAGTLYTEHSSSILNEISKKWDEFFHPA